VDEREEEREEEGKGRRRRRRRIERKEEDEYDIPISGGMTHGESSSVDWDRGLQSCGLCGLSWAWSLTTITTKSVDDMTQKIL
jgi:transcription elongation factor Elf1